MQCQQYQSEPLCHAYQKSDKKRVYQVNDKDVEDQLEDFYITFENEERDVTYLDKGFGKVLVNFVKIETTCLKCRSFFFSKSKLHKYVKAGYIKEALPLSSTQPSSSISIIMSKATYQSLGSSLGFKGWTYATASITLTPEHLRLNFDSDSIACFDTGCGVTFVDRDWLLKRLPYQKICTISTLLKVRGIGASKYESVEFAVLSLYFPGKDNAEQLVYVALKCEIHLVEELQANLLISNNILSPEGVVIDIGGRSALIGSCGVTVTINAKQQRQFLARKLFAAQDTIVPPCLKAMVSFHQVLLPEN